MKKLSQRILTLVLALTAMLMMAACSSGGSSDAGSTTALTRIKEKGKIVIGCDPAMETVCFQDVSSGKMVGFIPEMINGWAEAMGVEVEWQTLEWSAMITAVNTGKVDMVAADMNRTVERATNITFCDPWIVDAPMAVVGKASSYATFDDLMTPGTRFGVVAGSVYETIIPQIFPDSEVVTIPMGSWADALKSGIIDANFNGAISCSLMINADPDSFKLLVPESSDVTAVRYAFAVAQGDYALADCFNIYLSELKCNGEYAEMYKKWIGTEWTPELDGVSY